jgi:hypothetical protein
MLPLAGGMHTACEAGTSGKTAPLQPNTLADPQWLLTTQDTREGGQNLPTKPHAWNPQVGLAGSVQGRLHRGPILPFSGTEQLRLPVAATKASCVSKGCPKQPCE